VVLQPATEECLSHADYSLHEDKFRAPSNLFEVEGIRSSELPLETVVELVKTAR